MSSLRILSAKYGTRCSTVVRVTSAGTIDFAECSYRADGEIAGEVRYRLDMVSPERGAGPVTRPAHTDNAATAADAAPSANAIA
jgi:hypothetical protein